MSSTSVSADSAASDSLLSLPNGVAIRSYRDSDAAILAQHGNNRRIWNQLRDRLPNPYTAGDAATWFAMVRDPANQTRSGAWTLTSRRGEGPTAPKSGAGPLRATHFAITVHDEPVGSVGLEFGRDVYFRTAELGYWLSEAHWGRGIMGMVVPAFVRWAWATFGVLGRIEAEVRVDNGGSRRVVTKAGFVEEGTKRKALCKSGEVFDVVFYGLLRPGTE